MHAGPIGGEPTNYSPQAKWKHHHFHSFISSMAATITEASSYDREWPIKLIKTTLWAFTEKVCQPPKTI